MNAEAKLNVIRVDYPNAPSTGKILFTGTTAEVLEWSDKFQKSLETEAPEWTLENLIPLFGVAIFYKDATTTEPWFALEFRDAE